MFYFYSIQNQGQRITEHSYCGGIDVGTVYRSIFLDTAVGKKRCYHYGFKRNSYTIRSSVAILQQIPMSIEEAAISLGASKMKSFFRITVPMMTAGIVSGAILSWVTMISELSTAIILYTGKTKTLTVAIYTEVIRGNYGTAVHKLNCFPCSFFIYGWKIAACLC